MKRTGALALAAAALISVVALAGCGPRGNTGGLGQQGTPVSTTPGSGLGPSSGPGSGPGSKIDTSAVDSGLADVDAALNDADGGLTAADKTPEDAD